MNKPKSFRTWKWIAAGTGAAGILIASAHLPLVSWMLSFHERISDSGPGGVVLFIGVYILATVLFIPGTALNLGAGAAFGPVLGAVAVSIGATTGAALAFLIARYAARERVEKWAAAKPTLWAVDKAIELDGWKIVGLLRLSPVAPFIILNFFFGVTAIRFWPYVLASWAGMLPSVVLYTWLGHAGKTGLEAAAGIREHRSLIEYGFLTLGIIITIAVTVYVARQVSKNLRKIRSDTKWPRD